MTWLVLLAGAVAAWAWKTGRLPAVRLADVAAVVIALVAVRMFGQGRLVLPIFALAGAAYWLYFRTQGEPAGGMDAAEAEALLEVSPDADRAAILSAHRRLIARVHPDAGGSAELARRVNAARDTLLTQLRRRG